MGLLADARALLAAGFSPLPIAAGRKSPPIRWAEYQTAPAAEEALLRWFGPHSLGVVCGYGGLEVVDIDDPSLLDSFLNAMPCDLRNALTRIARTPSGGAHVWYVRPTPAGNTKLAHFENGEVRIETRGVGGLVVCPPTPGYVWVSDGPVPRLSESDASVLWAVARSFDLAVVPDAADVRDDRTAWDDYQERGDADGLLTRFGWTRDARGFQGCSLWTRPGKDPRDGHSARFGPWRGDGKRFYCWSSSAGLPTKLLTLPALRAHLEFGGDYSACARQLASEGYGRAAAPHRARPAQGEMLSSDERPRIQVGGAELYAQLVELREAVASAGADFDLYLASGRVARVVEDDEGLVRLEEATTAAAAAELSRHVRFYRYGKGNAYPPKELVAAWLASPGGEIKRVSMLCPGPTIRPDGSVAHRLGHDPASGYFLSSGYGRLDPLDESPADSVAYLERELFADFRFVSPADRANAFGLLFLPFVRGLFAGPTPLHVVKSHTPGSGKGKLLQACLMPYFGREVSLTPAPRDEDEMRKKIATKLDGGARAIVFDNVTRRMESESLDAALTSTVYEDRRLGSSSPIVARNLAVWCCTLNNPTLSTDLARRSVTIAIDPGVENPWTRDPSGFRHPALERWIRENLYDVRRRVLNVIGAWTRAGFPKADAALGSFEAYAETIGGVLAFAKIEGFIANHAEAFSEMAEESAMWGALLAHLYECGLGRFTVARLWTILEDDPTRFDGVRAALGEGADGSRRRKLGWLLKRIEGRVFSGFFVKPSGLLDGNKTYRVVTIGDSGESSGFFEAPKQNPLPKPTSLFEPEDLVAREEPTADSGSPVGSSGFVYNADHSEEKKHIYRKSDGCGSGEKNPLEPTPADLDPFSAEALGLGGAGGDAGDGDGRGTWE